MRTFLTCLALLSFINLCRADGLYVCKEDCAVYDGRKITARMPAYTAVPGRRHPQYADWLLVQREGKTCEVEAKYFISETELERELNRARRDLLEKKRELEEASFDR